MQSEVKEHAELFLLLGMITPLGWLERSPSYKEMRENITDRDLALYGFLGYPVLMTADIILYKATRVPVGADQVPHLELSREIARRFNFHYGEVFPEPQPLLTEAAKVLGTDGRKMSKSYGNAIDLGESAESTTKKIMGMVTDPAAQAPAGPGEPGRVRHLLPAQGRLATPDTVAWVDQNCRTAGIGCVDCKKKLLERLVPRAGADAREARGAPRAAEGPRRHRRSSARARRARSRSATMVEVRGAMRDRLA